MYLYCSFLGQRHKAYWLSKEQFTKTDEILYRNRDHCDEKDLVVPRGLAAEATQLTRNVIVTFAKGSKLVTLDPNILRTFC